MTEDKREEQRVEMAYGRGKISLRIPAGLPACVLRKPAMPVPPDPALLVRQALEDPCHAQPLAMAAAGCQSACIVICDNTRPVPNGLILRPLIERLRAAGIPQAGIVVLIATGMHEPTLGEELAEVVGDPWVQAQVRIVNHDAHDDQQHCFLGQTPEEGTPVVINRLFVEADIKVVVGLVEPHFMAGYSGGRKVIAPGIAHHTTVRTFHSGRFMQHPQTRPCNLTGNILHQEQLAIASFLNGPIYSFNTVINEERQLLFAHFGELVTSHLQAVDFVRSLVEVPVDRRFPLIVTSAAGHPLDQNYYQTVKGLIGPLDILQPGGTLLMISSCSAGLGSDHFRASQQRLLRQGVDGFLQHVLAKKLADVDEWETQMLTRALQRGRIELFAPLLTEQDQQLTGLRCHQDAQQAVDDLCCELKPSEIALIPEGPYITPVLA